MGKEVPYYSEEDIRRVLPLENIIHHPTVVMKREAFEKAGLYRNFPCAQRLRLMASYAV